MQEVASVVVVVVVLVLVVVVEVEVEVVVVDVEVVLVLVVEELDVLVLDCNVVVVVVVDGIVVVVEVDDSKVVVVDVVVVTVVVVEVVRHCCLAQPQPRSLHFSWMKAPMPHSGCHGQTCLSHVPRYPISEDHWGFLCTQFVVRQYLSHSAQSSTVVVRVVVMPLTHALKSSWHCRICCSAWSFSHVLRSRCRFSSNWHLCISVSFRNSIALTCQS